MTWFPVGMLHFGGGAPRNEVGASGAAVDILVGGQGKVEYTLLDYVNASLCSSCKKVTLWNGGLVMYPKASSAPHPSPDLPGECLPDYREAACIVNDSPRGAAALLRLAIQKLCVQLGGKGKKIDDDIAFLVAEKELPERARKALDAVRVIGNNAVHPGEMDLRDDVETAIALFKAINVIVHATITQPREMDALYDGLPDGAKAAADRRDGRVEAKE